MTMRHSFLTVFLLLVGGVLTTRGNGLEEEITVNSSTTTDVTSTTSELLSSKTELIPQSTSEIYQQTSEAEPTSLTTVETESSTIIYTTMVAIDTTEQTLVETTTAERIPEIPTTSEKPKETEFKTTAKSKLSDFFSPIQPPRGVNSLQDIFKKMDGLASEAIMGTFEKEEVHFTPPPPTEEDNEKLSNQIRAALKYYKDYRKVAIPGADIPDPFSVPMFSKKMGGTPFSFFNTSMYGMSNYSIEHINTNLEKMQVYIEVFMPRLVVLGNYTAKSWFKKAAGPFNVTLLNVTASGAAALARDENGNLMATDSQMDMQFTDGRVDFKNLGLMGSLLQGILSGAAPILFEAIKPIVLSEINDKVRADVNKRMKIIGKKFVASNASSPLDQAIEEARTYIRNNNYDPYRIQNYVLKQSVLFINISEFTLTGVSNFYKASDIELSMDNGTLELGLHIATGKLHGRCRWFFALGKRLSKTGWSNFTVNHIQTKFYVNQSLDTSKHPVLRKLDINVGKITMDMSGLGRLDIIAETLVNSLPDLLRHIMVDAIEIPIKIKAQEILNRIDVQDLIDKNLPELDRIGL